MGLIGDRQIVLLVDGGSTHNFIQLQLVSQLGLPTRTTNPLQVMVDNDRSRLAIWNDSKGWMESALLVKEKE